MSPSGQWAIAVHGGAGGISKNTMALPYEKALKSAVDAAYTVLDAARGSDMATVWESSNVIFPPISVAAALVAVESMEACTLFNAGKGAVLNNRAFVENEASVMDGATMKTGATCGRSRLGCNIHVVRTVVHPARLATLIYATADFQFLGFAAAEKYADKFPSLIERQEPTWFVTDRRRASLAKAQTRKTALLDHTAGTVQAAFSEKANNDEWKKPGAAAINTTEPSNSQCLSNEGETVGATVCDGYGNVACVTSTGGVTNKWEGRIGDTPVIGAGSYASNKSCAVSGTGWGEQFLRYSAASRICFAMEYGGMSAKDATYDVVRKVFPDDTGGFICVTPTGEVVMDFNSIGMFRACRTWQGQDEIKIWE